MIKYLNERNMVYIVLVLSVKITMNFANVSWIVSELKDEVAGYRNAN